MRKRPSNDQIASILRQIKDDMHAGLSMLQALRKAGIGPTTYYRWKALVETPAAPEAQRTRELEQENERLKLLVAELAMDRRMLQEALKKKP